MLPHGTACMNGEFIQLSEAKIPTLDWGFLRSDATYDLRIILQLFLTI